MTLPLLDWLRHYRRADLTGDVLAGVLVTIMLVPQSMAYAMLAGLPPQVGLYASIAPLVLYSLLGTSRTLAVGPVAMVSLLVATGVGSLAAPGSAEYVTLALMLAAMIGVIQLLMGGIRLGFLVNFLSHPVLSGFTSAAGLVIGFSQLKHLLGISLPSAHHPYELLLHSLRHVGATHGMTLAIGLSSVALLLYCSTWLQRHVQRLNVPPLLWEPLTRSGPLVVVLLSTLAVWLFGLHDNAGVKIVGAIPAGLPPLRFPAFPWGSVGALFPVALTIALVGFLESISIATTLASKRRQKVEADQELIALGAANLAAACTGGYPVTGGLSRSVVNFTAGARTNLASLITAALMALTVLFLTPLFYYLPQATLAAIIVVAVSNLIDVATCIAVWRYSKADAASLIATFAGVLVFDIEIGIALGVATALGLYLWRTSRPHIAVVGRVGGTEHYRNVLRHHVKTSPNILTVRVDESLYFANTRYLETTLLSLVADRPDVKHVVLVCSAINFIDASALETLETLLAKLRDAGVALSLAEVKGPVMDGLQKTDFLTHLGVDRVFLSTHQAVQTLGGVKAGGR